MRVSTALLALFAAVPALVVAAPMQQRPHYPFPAASETVPPFSTAPFPAAPFPAAPFPASPFPASPFPDEAPFPFPTEFLPSKPSPAEFSPAALGGQNHDDGDNDASRSYGHFMIWGLKNHFAVAQLVIPFFARNFKWALADELDDFHVLANRIVAIDGQDLHPPGSGDYGVILDWLHYISEELCKRLRCALAETEATFTTFWELGELDRSLELDDFFQTQPASPLAMSLPSLAAWGPRLRDLNAAVVKLGVPPDDPFVAYGESLACLLLDGERYEAIFEGAAEESLDDVFNRPFTDDLDFDDAPGDALRDQLVLLVANLLKFLFRMDELYLTS